MPLTPYDGWRKRHLTKYFLKHFSGFHKESWIAKVFLFLRLLTTFHAWLWSYDMVGYLAPHIVVRVPGSKQPFLEYEYRARRADKSLEQIITCLFNGLERRFGNK